MIAKVKAHRTVNTVLSQRLNYGGLIGPKDLMRRTDVTDSFSVTILLVLSVSLTVTAQRLNLRSSTST